LTSREDKALDTDQHLPKQAGSYLMGRKELLNKNTKGRTIVGKKRTFLEGRISFPRITGPKMRRNHASSEEKLSSYFGRSWHNVGRSKEL
jgi:hypothetical protein